jgi:biopolymer transport protein ExbD
MISVTQKSLEEQESFFTDLTPLLDIIFLNLFFLILTINVSHHIIDLDLPAAQNTQQSVEETKQTLELHKDETYTFQQKKFTTLQDLKKYLIEHPEFLKSIRIAGDKDILFQLFVSIMDLLKSLNVKEIDLLVSPHS